MSRSLRLGTRRSALATTQSLWVADRLRALGHEVELLEIVTEGDVSTAPIAVLGGTGVFAAAIRRSLLTGGIDIAVHSLKDLPTAPEPGLTVAAIPAREDARDALVARDGLTLGQLPVGSLVGTGSPRRRAQLAALGLGLVLVDIRGNVDTRLATVARGELDAVVLARAGLSRLGRTREITETLDPLQVLPAAGQGALAVECRSDDDEVRALLGQLDDADTRACVSAERALLAGLEAGCTAPVGALAEIVEGEDGEELSLRAFAGSVDGGVGLRRSAVGPVTDATGVGRRLAELLLRGGAGALTPEPAADQAPGIPGQHRPSDPAVASGAPAPIADSTAIPTDPTASERAL